MENKPEKLQVNKEELRQRLTPLQYQVTQEAATERPFTGCYNKHYEKGMYQCIVCHQDLFSSETKYDSGCGWPAFNDVVDKGKVTLHRDASIPVISKMLGMVRTEVRCAKCAAHMGHVFDDGPPPKRMRYCINSASIEFIAYVPPASSSGGGGGSGSSNSAAKKASTAAATKAAAAATAAAAAAAATATTTAAGGATSNKSNAAAKSNAVAKSNTTANSTAVAATPAQRIRTEVRCAKCNAHMGHVFEDGPKPTRKRYCINSASIEFVAGAERPVSATATTTPANQPITTE